MLSSTGFTWGCRRLKGSEGVGVGVRRQVWRRRVLGVRHKWMAGVGRGQQASSGVCRILKGSLGVVKALAGVGWWSQ